MLAFTRMNASMGGVVVPCRGSCFSSSEEDGEPSSHFPFLQKTWIDSSGRLWATTRSYFGSQPSPDDPDPDPPGSIVEVFDMSTGSLLASRRFDVPVVLHDGLAYAPESTPAGGTTLRVFRPVFTGPNP